MIDQTQQQQQPPFNTSPDTCDTGFNEMPLEDDEWNAEANPLDAEESEEFDGDELSEDSGYERTLTAALQLWRLRTLLWVSECVVTVYFIYCIKFPILPRVKGVCTLTVNLFYQYYCLIYSSDDLNIFDFLVRFSYKI